MIFRLVSPNSVGEKTLEGQQGGIKTTLKMFIMSEVSTVANTHELDV